MSTGVKRRFRYEDFRPYEIPNSLSDLRGPKTGTVELPICIYWQPGSKVFDLSIEWQVEEMYQAVISEATAEDQARLLNRELLIDVWPRLSLPIKAAKLWEGRFPELRGNMKASWKLSC